MGALENIKNGITNSLGSGIVGLGLGTIKGMLQGDMQNNYAKKLAEKQQEIARQNALDKWSIEKASMQKAGINMAALNGMQANAIQQSMPTQGINNEAQIPSIAEGAQQMSQAEVNKTEKDKNEEFLKQASDYWASETKQRLADAQLKGAETAWTNVQKETGDYGLRVRKAVINAYGGELSDYGKALYQMWQRNYENIEQDTAQKMATVGLTYYNTRLAIQKTIESEQFIKWKWYEVNTNRMYQMGMLKLGQDRLEFDKNAFKSNLWFEMDKFNRSIGLEWKKFNWQKGCDEVQMQYTKTLIKNLDQERYWKPVTVLSQAFRDVAVGMGALNGMQSESRDNASQFKDFGIGAGAILGAAGGLAGTLGRLAMMAKFAR